MKQTNANLASDIATKAMMRWLVAAALDKSDLKYGDARQLLEQEVGFDRLARAGRSGYTAGTMIDNLLKIDKSAPLLNVLLVERSTGLPSDGAANYLADRFHEPLLKKYDAKNVHHKLWQQTFNKAAGQVYATSEEEWRRLYEAAYGEPLDEHEIAAERERRKKGSEVDGLDSDRVGEGPDHRALRLWVHSNPGRIDRRYRFAFSQTELVLDSADRVDVVFSIDDEIAAVEVKSWRSNLIDLRRGVYQCIKYRAVLGAMDVRQGGKVVALLVTEKEVPGEIKALLKKHSIKHILVPMDRS